MTKKQLPTGFYEEIQKDVRRGRLAVALAAVIAVVLAGTFAIDPVIVGNAVREVGLDATPIEARHSIFFMLAATAGLLVGAVYGLQQAAHRVMFQMTMSGSQITPEKERDLYDPKKREKTLRKLLSSIDAQIAHLSHISQHAIHKGHKVFLAVDELKSFARQSSDPYAFEHQLLGLKRDLMDHYGFLSSNQKKKEELLSKLVSLKSQFEESQDTMKELSKFRSDLSKLLGGVQDPFPLKKK